MTKAYGDIIETLPSWSDSESEEPHCIRSSKSLSKNFFINRQGQLVKQHSHPSKSSEEKKNFHLESESDDEALSTQMPHGKTTYSRRLQDWKWLSVDRQGRNKRTSKEDVPVIHPVNDRLREVLDIWTYDFPIMHPLTMTRSLERAPIGERVFRSVRSRKLSIRTTPLLLAIFCC